MGVACYKIAKTQKESLKTSKRTPPPGADKKLETKARKKALIDAHEERRQEGRENLKEEATRIEVTKLTAAKRAKQAEGGSTGGIVAGIAKTFKKSVPLGSSMKKPSRNSICVAKSVDTSAFSSVHPNSRGSVDLTIFQSQKSLNMTAVSPSNSVLPDSVPAVVEPSITPTMQIATVSVAFDENDVEDSMESFEWHAPGPSKSRSGHHSETSGYGAPIDDDYVDEEVIETDEDALDSSDIDSSDIDSDGEINEEGLARSAGSRSRTGSVSSRGRSDVTSSRYGSGRHRSAVALSRHSATDEIAVVVDEAATVMAEAANVTMAAATAFNAAVDMKRPPPLQEKMQLQHFDAGDNISLPTCDDNDSTGSSMHLNEHFDNISLGSNQNSTTTAQPLEITLKNNEEKKRRKSKGGRNFAGSTIAADDSGEESGRRRKPHGETTVSTPPEPIRALSGYKKAGTNPDEQMEAKVLSKDRSMTSAVDSSQTGSREFSLSPDGGSRRIDIKPTRKHGEGSGTGRDMELSEDAKGAGKEKDTEKESRRSHSPGKVNSASQRRRDALAAAAAVAESGRNVTSPRSSSRDDCGSLMGDPSGKVTLVDTSNSLTSRGQKKTPSPEGVGLLADRAVDSKTKRTSSPTSMSGHRVKPSMLEIPEACEACKKVCEVQMCVQCLTVGYCSRECQKLDWGRHKRRCKKIKKTRATRHGVDL